MKRTLSMSFAILLCINIAAWAETIQLPAGVLGVQVFKSGNTYIGANHKPAVATPSNPLAVGAGSTDTIIRYAFQGPFSYTANLNGLRDVTLIGITFDGNGLSVSNTVNVKLQNVSITNARRGRDNHQGISGGGNTNLTFDHVTWDNCSQVIQLYNGSNTLLTDSIFRKSGYGYKHGMGGGRGLTIRRVIMDQMRSTMGAEIQNDQAEIDNVLIEDCAYINPELGADDSRNGNAMAYSFPMAKATNVVGRRNYADGYAWIIDNNGNRTGERRVSRPGWHGLRIGCEVGGTNPKWYENWMVNLNDPGAITTSQLAECFNNRIERCMEPWNAASGAQNIKRLDGNGPSTALPAFGGWSLVGVSSGGSTPAPAAPQIAQPPPGTIMRPGVAYTASGTGTGLQWAVDRTNDGAPEVATGSGSSITFTVPADSTASHAIRVTLSGAGGQDVENYAIETVDPVPVLLARIKQLEDQLAAALAKLVEWDAWYSKAPR